MVVRDGLRTYLGHPPALHFGDGEDAADRVDVGDEREGGVERVEDLLVEIQPARFYPWQQRGIVDEREGQVVARAEDDGVAMLHHRLVNEGDLLAVDSLNIGFDLDLPLLEPRNVFVFLLDEAVVCVFRPSRRWWHACPTHTRAERGAYQWALVRGRTYHAA